MTSNHSDFSSFENLNRKNSTWSTIILDIASCHLILAFVTIKYQYIAAHMITEFLFHL